MTYQQLELLLAGPREIHWPDLVDIPERYDEDDLMARAAPDSRLPRARRVWALVPRHMRSNGSPPLQHLAPFLNSGHDTILDVREVGIWQSLSAPFEAA
jgi:hypothetical protein